MGESAPDGVAIPTLPLLKPWYRLSADGASAVLRYGSSVLEFEGLAATRLLPHLLPLLDGSRTVERIVAQLGEPIRPAIENALALLAQQGLLTEAAPPELDDDRRRAVEFLAATDSFGRTAPAVYATLAESRVVVLGAAAAADAIAGLLERSAVADVSRRDWRELDDGTADLVVAAPASAEMPLLADWNGVALERGTIWMQVLPFDGLIAAVGPIFVPGATACHECYRLRRAANIGPLRDTARGEYPSSPAFDALLAGLAATVALRRLALEDGFHLGVVLAVEQGYELACTRHVLHRVPRCPACSPSATRAVLAPWHGATDVAA